MLRVPMAPQSSPYPSVLIIDGDPAIRGLIEKLLKRAGFLTLFTADIESATVLLHTTDFAVILRDLNLTPSQQCRSLELLAATAPEQLRRTVLLTTAPVRAATEIASGTVFAIVSKPFDNEELVEVVRSCVRDAHDRNDFAVKQRRSPPPSRTSEAGASARRKLDGLPRFARKMPNLHHLLSASTKGEREAVPPAPALGDRRRPRLPSAAAQTPGARVARTTSKHAEGGMEPGNERLPVSRVVSRVDTEPAGSARASASATKHDH